MNSAWRHSSSGDRSPHGAGVFRGKRIPHSVSQSGRPPAAVSAPSWWLRYWAGWLYEWTLYVSKYGHASFSRTP